MTKNSKNSESSYFASANELRQEVASAEVRFQEARQLAEERLRYLTIMQTALEFAEQREEKS